MNLFVAGTDTDIGKTLVSSWLCLHSGYSYFKPIQSGSGSETDSQVVSRLTGTKIHPEIYRLQEPLSPHQAAKIDKVEIDLESIILPRSDQVLVEGAGGLLVPINDDLFVVDVIKHLNLPVILVAKSGLGTINHTLLSLEALRKRHILVLGVVLTGSSNPPNRDSIEKYGNIQVLGELPQLATIDRESLSQIPLPKALHQLLKGQS
jgi:dethiobiotin synthetase